MNRHPQRVIDDLVEDNKLLKAALGKKRVRLDDDQRPRLAILGKALEHAVARPTISAIPERNGVAPSPSWRTTWATFQKARAKGFAVAATASAPLRTVSRATGAASIPVAASDVGTIQAFVDAANAGGRIELRYTGGSWTLGVAH